MRKNTAAVVCALFGALLLVGLPALAQTTKDEAKCQDGASLGLAKFAKKKWQCITKCEQRAYRIDDPNVLSPAECAPPFGGSTLTCVTDVAEPKASEQFAAKCTKDCPECYAGGDCLVFEGDQIAAFEADVDVLRNLVFCDEPDELTAEEFKCQKTVAVQLRNFGFTKMKCLRSCRKKEAAGKATGSCDPQDPGLDEKTARCIQRKFDRVVAKIDKKCGGGPNTELPQCYTDAGYTTGAAWANLVEADVDASDPLLFCDDPNQP